MDFKSEETLLSPSLIIKVLIIIFLTVLRRRRMIFNKNTSVLRKLSPSGWERGLETNKKIDSVSKIDFNGNNDKFCVNKSMDSISIEPLLSPNLIINVIIIFFLQLFVGGG